MEKQSNLIQKMQKHIAIEVNTIKLIVIGLLYQNIGDNKKALNDY